MPSTDPRRTDFGPVPVHHRKGAHEAQLAALRLFGVDHIAVAWMDEDKEWTTEKGRQNNNLASNTVPLLDRATASAKEAAKGAPGHEPLAAGEAEGAA